MNTNPADSRVARFVLQNAMIALQSYQYGLRCAIEAIENRWLPEPTNPAIALHLETLRSYLENNGHSVPGKFLLGLGLTAPGVQRGINPPLVVLDENRGGFSERRQREAADYVTRLRDAIEIGKWFLPGLATDTHAAILELAEAGREFDSKVPEFPSTLDFIRQLSDEEINELLARALEALQGPVEPIREVGIGILRNLACLCDAPLPEAACQKLVDQRLFWPTCLFRGAGEHITEQLATAIDESPGSVTLGHLLMSLAWTRSSVATAAFREWRKHQPTWSAKLNVLPEEYLLYAGWRLDENNEPQDLYSSHCFLMTPADSDATVLIRTRSKAEAQCPRCTSDLYWLFDFSRSAIDFAQIGLAEAPQRVLVCLPCAAFVPVYAKYSSDGSAELILPEEGYNPEEHWEFSGRARDHVYSRVPTFACADQFTLADATSLGGVPTWIQDAEYPRCIDCGRYMKFLAQRDNGELGEEGIYYAFYCGSCRVSAVTYQQT